MIRFLSLLTVNTFHQVALGLAKYSVFNIPERLHEVSKRCLISVPSNISHKQG